MAAERARKGGIFCGINERGNCGNGNTLTLSNAGGTREIPGGGGKCAENQKGDRIDQRKDECQEPVGRMVWSIQWGRRAEMVTALVDHQHIAV